MMKKTKTFPLLDIKSPELMELFRLGDEQAFSIVFNRFYSALCYFSSHLINDRPGAEDLAKDAFTKLWINRKKYDDLNKIKAFLYITVRNASLNFIRHMKVRSATAKEMVYLHQDVDDSTVLAGMIKSEFIQLLLAEIEKLPTKRKVIFRLAYLEELSNEAISNLLNISISTVKTQKARSMLAIRISAKNWMFLFTVSQLLRFMLQSS